MGIIRVSVPQDGDLLIDIGGLFYPLQEILLVEFDLQRYLGDLVPDIVDIDGQGTDAGIDELPPDETGIDRLVHIVVFAESGDVGRQVGLEKGIGVDPCNHYGLSA